MIRLHLRARHVEAVSAGLVVLVIVGAASAHWLATRSCFGGPRARVPVAVLVPLLAAVLVSSTLAGADVELERSVPRMSRGQRVRHALVGSFVTTAVVALCAPDHAGTFGSLALSRNTLGLTGLVLISAVVLPAALAWAPALGYSVVVYLAAPHLASPASTWWAWPMPEGRLDGSWVVAVVLLSGGVLGYATLGPARPDPDH